MPRLSQIPDQPIAIDLRIDLRKAKEMRAAWPVDYSIWPDDPFGASADQNVWPSVFVDPGQASAERIVIEPGEAPYWDAFNMWDDVRDMMGHMRPLPIVTDVVALGLDRDPSVHLPQDFALAGLAQNGVSPETREMEAVLLGYDVTDGVLESALFAHDGIGLDFEVRDVQRSVYGLIGTLDAARSLRRRLEPFGPPNAPLHCISVWSLGERPATR
ncbi:hypothetical protein [Jannaschia sp. LMIT008]|uniref:hypothetical protein n=1 Tax=Jannaschia maritima TaxID=3032585 RepID=UPI002811F6C0|nr:hypothetical protein [Jannaschia sp. LMIT008]